MKPPPPPTNHTPSPAHHGGFFILYVFREKTCTELTEVNKLDVNNYKSIHCKFTIFPTVKPAHAMVNKMRAFLTHDSLLTTNY